MGDRGSTWSGCYIRHYKGHAILVLIEEGIEIVAFGARKAAIWVEIFDKKERFPNLGTQRAVEHNIETIRKFAAGDEKCAPLTRPDIGNTYRKQTKGGRAGDRSRRAFRR